MVVSFICVSVCPVCPLCPCSPAPPSPRCLLPVGLSVMRGKITFARAPRNSLYPDQRCAHGMYRTQLRLQDGVPAHPGPWQHDSAAPGFVLMHGVLGDLICQLRAALLSRPNAPGTQFYWRATPGSYETVSKPTSGDPSPAPTTDVAIVDALPTTTRGAETSRSSPALALTGGASADSLSLSDTTGCTLPSAAPAVIAPVSAAPPADAVISSPPAAPPTTSSLAPPTPAVSISDGVPTSAPLPDGHVDVAPATPYALFSAGSAPSFSAWDDEEELLRAIEAEHSSPHDARVAVDASSPDDDDPSDVRPPPRTLAPPDPSFSTPIALRSAPPAPIDSASSSPSLARTVPTAILVADLMPPATPSPPRPETLLVWNAAGWWSGDREGGTAEHQDIAAARYDVLDPLLRGRDAPTYIVLNEVSGSLRESTHPRGLRAWLSAAGYGHHFYPGGSLTRRRSDGSASATGGLLLAWLQSETSACGSPHFDPKAMTIALDFRHRRCAVDAPPMRLIAAYGSHQRNGKRQALRSIVRHIMHTRGCIAAGDLNVVPGPRWKCSARRTTVDDDEFAAITGGGELPDAGTSMASIVDLGLQHAQGQFTRAHWTARLADGSPKGTATLDHVLTAGLERGRWRRRAAWFAFDGDHRLVSDHMIIIVAERAPRTVATDDQGVHRPPRYLVDRWTERQRAVFLDSFDVGLQQLRANQWRARPEDARQSLATGAAAIVQLVALLNAAAISAEAAAPGDTLGDRLRRVHGGGGGLKGVKAQLKRQQGILRVVRSARLAVEHATSALATLRPDALAHCRLRAELQLQCALTSERELFTPTSATYFARHDRNLHRVVARSYAGPPAQAAAARAFAVVSRLQRDISYYSQQMRKLERRADRPIWQGVSKMQWRAAAATPLSPRCAVRRSTMDPMAGSKGSSAAIFPRSRATVCKSRASGLASLRPYAPRPAPSIGASTMPTTALALKRHEYLAFTPLYVNPAGPSFLAATARRGNFPTSATMTPFVLCSSGCTRTRPPPSIGSPRRCSNFFRKLCAAPSTSRQWRSPLRTSTVLDISRRIGREFQSSCSTRRPPRPVWRRSAISAFRPSCSSCKQGSTHQRTRTSYGSTSRELWLDAGGRCSRRCPLRQLYSRPFPSSFPPAHLHLC